MLQLVYTILVVSSLVIGASAGNFYQDVEITWGGEQRAKILNGGQQLTLSLDKFSGSGFQSKKEYLFGRFDMQLKLVPGNSAGTVTTYYLSSQGPNHDEIDFEFLGNVSGQPYTVHTNVFSQGKGDREQQFHLWFDPTTSFHTYSILWYPQRIIFMVDNIPIRVFDNNEAIGVPFPTSQPMRVYSSLWNADDWATQGGLVKTDWTKAPFTASYKNFNATTYINNNNNNGNGNGNSSTNKSSTTTDLKNGNGAATSQQSSSSSSSSSNYEIDSKGRNRMRWVRMKCMIYDYCNDLKRFPQGLPRECKRTRSL